MPGSLGSLSLVASSKKLPSKGTNILETFDLVDETGITVEQGYGPICSLLECLERRFARAED